MNLSQVLVNKFAKVTNDTSTKKPSTSIKGTAVVENGSKYVRLDGSDILTPVSEATDIQNGDRVLVSIENHTATVVGNYTCPASARTASNYMRLREDGLLIGELDAAGNAVGTGALITPGTYYIIDDNGKVLSSFSSDGVKIFDAEGHTLASFGTSGVDIRATSGNLLASFGLNGVNLCNEAGEIIASFGAAGVNLYDADGNILATFSSSAINIGDANAIIRFCGGKCRIYSSSDGTMVLYADNAVGMRSTYATETKTYRAEVVCNAETADPIVSIQAYEASDTDPVHISLSRSGVGVVAPKFSYGGSSVVTSKKLVASGTITATGAVGQFSNVIITKAVSVPSGYRLAGIREISSNYPNACQLSGFYTHPSTNVIGARLKNVGSQNITDLTVTIEWFALYSDGPAYVVDDVITFETDDDIETTNNE